MAPHFTAVEAAYQLHYYLCFKTHHLRPFLATTDTQVSIRQTIDDVCNREQYHLLEADITYDHLRVLLSLKPDQTVSNAVRMLKGNTDRQFALTFTDRQESYRKLWANGYFARSSGKIDLKTAQRYVDSQVSHHGYKGTWTKPLSFHNPTFKSPAFKVAHSFSILNYHIVLATQDRTSLFDETIGPRLFDYVMAIGRKHSFAVDRIGLLPDHVHFIVEAVPRLSVEDLALALLENTRHWMMKHYWGVLKETRAWDVWQPSFYAGTVGAYSTAQVKKFLSAGSP